VKVGFDRLKTTNIDFWSRVNPKAERRLKHTEIVKEVTVLCKKVDD
jgi:hypothetical protein